MNDTTIAVSEAKAFVNTNLQALCNESIESVQAGPKLLELFEILRPVSNFPATDADRMIRSAAVRYVASATAVSSMDEIRAADRWDVCGDLR